MGPGALNGLCVLGRLCLLGCLAALGCTTPSLGPVPANVDARGVALAGFDPVTYFPEGGGVPRPGSSDIVARHEGAIYRFTGNSNRSRFLGDPTRYVPLYGGWDAWSMVDGQREDVDPTNFLIRDERLLLFLDGTFVDGREKWLARDHADLRRRADQAWFTLLSNAQD